MHSYIEKFYYMGQCKICQSIYDLSVIVTLIIVKQFVSFEFMFLFELKIILQWLKRETTLLCKKKLS